MNPAAYGSLIRQSVWNLHVLCHMRARPGQLPNARDLNENVNTSAVTTWQMFLAKNFVLSSSAIVLEKSGTHNLSSPGFRMPVHHRQKSYTPGMHRKPMLYRNHMLTTCNTSHRVCTRPLKIVRWWQQLRSECVSVCSDSTSLPMPELCRVEECGTGGWTSNR